MSISETEIADRVIAVLGCFEARSGMTSEQFEERQARGEFDGLVWAPVWQAVIAGRMQVEALPA